MNLPKTDSELLLLHNPRCSKSRAALALLTEKGVVFGVREYLEDPLSRDELAELRRRLDRPVREWARQREAPFEAAGLGPDAADAPLLDLIAEQPIVMERPILIRGKRAVVGRPTEDLLTLLR